MGKTGAPCSAARPARSRATDCLHNTLSHQETLLPLGAGRRGVDTSELVCVSKALTKHSMQKSRVRVTMT